MLQVALCLFFFWAEKYSIVCVYIYTHHIFFIHSFVDGHLGCFSVLAIVNSAAMNTGVHVSFQIIIFSGHMPWCGIVRSYGSSIFSFFFLINYFTLQYCIGFAIHWLESTMSVPHPEPSHIPPHNPVLNQHKLQPVIQITVLLFRTTSPNTHTKLLLTSVKNNFKCQPVKRLYVFPNKYIFYIIPQAFGCFTCSEKLL